MNRQLFVTSAFHPAHILRNNRKLYGVLKHDTLRATGLANGSWRPRWSDAEYILNPTADQVVDVLKSMRGKKVAWDIETDGRHPLICDVRCIAFYDGVRAICVPFLFRDGTREEYVPEGSTRVKHRAVWKKRYAGSVWDRVLGAVRALLTDRSTFLYTQNGQYDRLCMKARLQVDAQAVNGFDTILGHHVVASFFPHGLDFLTSMYTDLTYYKQTDDGEAWSSIDDPSLWLYNCRDVKVTWIAGEKIAQEVLRERPEDPRIYAHDAWRERMAQAWKEAGIAVDVECNQLLAEFYGDMAVKALEQMKQVVSSVVQMAGSSLNEDSRNEHLTRLMELLTAKADEVLIDSTGNEHEVFNPGSLRQLRSLLLGLGIPLTEETATGEISTAAEFLLEARKQLLERKVPKDDSRIAFLDYLFAWREASKTVSTFLQPEILPDGRVHPTFNVHVVPTGRASSSGPNFQNQPGDIRGVYVPKDEDHCFVKCDWDSGEMRLSALLSGDKTFIDEFAAYDAGKGFKIHIMNAAAIFGLPASADFEKKYPGCYRASKIFAYLCFARGTQVALLNGKKPIEECRPGDQTWCWDGNKLVPTRIKYVWNNGKRECVKLTVKDGVGKLKSVIVTPTHPMMMRDGSYKRVSELKSGDRLMPFRRRAERPNHRVVSVEPAGEHEVWDIEVEHEAHNFPLADFGTMVHNTAYGGGENTAFDQVRAEMPDLSWDAFKICFQNYKKKRAGLFTYMADVVRRGTQHQYLDSEVLKRRVYFFERTFGDDSPEASAMMNMPMQSGLADVVQLANRRMEEEIVPKYVKKLKPGEVCRQLLEVHDEILYELPKRLAESFLKDLKKTCDAPPDLAHAHWANKLPVAPETCTRWKPVKFKCQWCGNKTEFEKKRGGVGIWLGTCEKCGGESYRGLKGLTLPQGKKGKVEASKEKKSA